MAQTTDGNIRGSRQLQGMLQVKLNKYSVFGKWLIRKVVFSLELPIKFRLCSYVRGLQQIRGVGTSALF